VPALCSPQTVPPYAALAACYDQAMRHVDYAAWAAHIAALLARFGCAPRSVLELACGTGSIGLQLAALGLPVRLGVDGSEAMLRVARQRARQAARPLRFARRDLRRLGDLGRFDAALCLYDSMNYLLALDDLVACLQGVHDVLEPGGLFVFDVCTELNSRRYFADYRERESGPGFAYERHSHYDPATRIQANDFVIALDGHDEPLAEHHRQRIYPLAEIRAAVERTPLELLGVFDDLSFAAGSEESDRVHFVTRRPPAAAAAHPTRR